MMEQKSSIWNIITGVEPVQIAYKTEGCRKQKTHMETEDAQETFDRIKYQLESTTRKKKTDFYRAAYFGPPEVMESRR